MSTSLKPTPKKTSLPVVCPDYDEDCPDMTYEEALSCYEGFPCNSHLMASGLFGPEGMGRACGYCPILTELN